MKERGIATMQASRRTKRAARHLYRFCLVDGVLDPGRVRLVAQHLASSTRRGAPPILGAFPGVVRLDPDGHRAVVVRAPPLVDGLRASIRADLARGYGPAIDATFREDPALIAGMRVRVGSDVYDDSVRARLVALQNRL